MVSIRFFDDPKALAGAVYVLYFDPLAPKSLVLPLLLCGQLPVFRFCVRNLTPGVRFGDADVAQVRSHLDFSMNFQGRFLEDADVRFASFQLYLAMFDDFIFLTSN